MFEFDYLNNHYPIRKTEDEKKRFRDYVIKSCSELGIEARAETTSNGKNINIIVGEPTLAKAVFTAHYDTPARSLFPNIMIPKNKLVFYAYQFAPIIALLVVALGISYLLGIILLNNDLAYFLLFTVLYYGGFYFMMLAFKNPHNYNDNTSGVAVLLKMLTEIKKEELNEVAFIFFDNEEKGKKGSLAYFKDHKSEMNDRFLINFDCVANGNNIIFIAQDKAIGSDEYKLLETSFEKNDKYHLEFCTCKEANSNSDHKSFPKGVACVTCHRSKLGILYTPHIHTPKDVVAEIGNLDYLAKNTLSFIRNLL